MLNNKSNSKYAKVFEVQGFEYAKVAVEVTVTGRYKYTLECYKKNESDGTSERVVDFGVDLYVFVAPYIHTGNTKYLKHFNQYCEINNDFKAESFSVLDCLWKGQFSTRHRDLYKTDKLIDIYSKIRGIHLSDTDIEKVVKLVENFDLRSETLESMSGFLTEFVSKESRPELPTIDFGQDT